MKSRSRTRRVLTPLDSAKAYEIVWQQVAPIFECGRLFADVSYVYFVGEEDDGPVKIGLAKDPIARLRGMQIGNPRRLRVEYALLGDIELEKLLHEFWREHAIFSSSTRGRRDAHPRTEWFRPEVRTDLFPIIATAANDQAAYLADGIPEDFGFEMAEDIVRDAHTAHDFIVNGRDVPRIPTANGYAFKGARPRI